MFRAFVISLVCFTSPLAAAERRSDDALTFYSSGDWERAEQVAVTASDARSRTLASQAVLARLMVGVFADEPRGERRAIARRAQAHARAALDIDPDFAPAHLRLAAGFGYEGRYVSPLRAAMMRLPQRGREHIETAIALDPDDPWGPAMLGAWHLEVTRRAGAGTFGADPEFGLAQYRAAMDMTVDEPAIPYHFALALIAADPLAHGAEARDLIDQAITCDDDTAFGREAKALAASLGALLSSDPTAAQAEAVRRLEQ